MEDIKFRTKNGGRYSQYEDMKPIKDSMQFDSDTEICSYVSPDGKFTVTIEVRGEVRLTYNDETYTKPSEFPQEVKEIIKNGDLWNNDEVYIGNNNWFELFIWDCDGDYIDSDVVDIEGKTPEDIAEYCETCLEKFRRDAGV